MSLKKAEAGFCSLKSYLIILSVIVFGPVWGNAELIVLKNGGYITGEVAGKTDTLFKIRTASDLVISLRQQDVDYISSDKNDAPVKEYLNRLKALDTGDARGHEQLGAYCFENKLYTPAVIEWQKALRYEPGLEKNLEPRLKEAVFREGLEKIRYFFRQGRYARVKLLAMGIIDVGKDLDLAGEEHNELKKMFALAKEKIVDPVITEPRDEEVEQAVKQADFEEGLEALGGKSAVRSLIELIGLSRDNINGYVSGLSQTSVFNALINACLRGVKVSLTVSEDNIEANILQLESIGAEIIKIRHKQAWLSYVVFDNKYLWLCPYGTGHDYIEEKRSALVSNYLPLAGSYNDFYKQINEKKKHKRLKETGQQTEKYEFTFGDGRYIEVFFGEGAAIRKEIIERIRAARQKLYFFTPVFNDRIIEESFKRLQKKGIKVHKAASPDSRAEAAVIIIDDRILALSSISLDKEGRRSVRQNLLLVYNRTLAELFYRELNQD